jgi:hypothetical protein
VPGRREMSDRDSVNISADFSLIGGQTSVSSVLLQVQGCHPGYMLQETTQTCVCDFSNGIIVQCDTANRYFYARVSISIHHWLVCGVYLLVSHWGNWHPKIL